MQYRNHSCSKEIDCVVALAHLPFAHREKLLGVVVPWVSTTRRYMGLRDGGGALSGDHHRGVVSAPHPLQCIIIPAICPPHRITICITGVQSSQVLFQSSSAPLVSGTDPLPVESHTTLESLWMMLVVTISTRRQTKLPTSTTTNLR